VCSCPRCLAPGQLASDCVSEIRYKSYFHYGHIKRQCLSSWNKQSIYRIKRVSPDLTRPVSLLIWPTALSPNNPSPPPSPTETPQTPHHDRSAPPSPSACTCASDHQSPMMAKYPCDPYPHLPPGTNIIPPYIHR
jgi:hypothetical protein